MYASRRDQYEYLFDTDTILDKYKNLITMHKRMSDALASAMGNEFFIAKFETIEEMNAFKAMVLAKK